VGQQHHPQHRDLAAPAAQELLELGGRLVQLGAGRAAALVAQGPALDQVAVPVEALELPLVAVAGHAGVQVLALDRDQPGRAEQQMIDLAAAIAVAAQQHPVVAEHAAELGRDLPFTGDPGPQDLFFVARCRGGRRRHRGEPPQPPDRGRPARPGEPAPPGPGLVPGVLGPPDQQRVPGRGVLVPGRAAGRVAAALSGQAQRVSRVIGQLDHAHGVQCTVSGAARQGPVRPVTRRNDGEYTPRRPRS